MRWEPTSRLMPTTLSATLSPWDIRSGWAAGRGDMPITNPHASSSARPAPLAGATSLPGDPIAGPFSATYAHDAHDNMTRMPHLPIMVWSEDDHLRATTRTAGATPPTTYYAYDLGGERVRKITEGKAAMRSGERVYLGGIEVYREFAPDGSTINLSRETFTVASGQQACARFRNAHARHRSRPGATSALPVRQPPGLRGARARRRGGGDFLRKIFSFRRDLLSGGCESERNVPKRYRFTGKERDDEERVLLPRSSLLSPATAGQVDRRATQGEPRGQTGMPYISE